MKKNTQPDWSKVPVRVVGDTTNASRLLGAAIVKWMVKRGKWVVVNGKLQASEVRG